MIRLQENVPDVYIQESRDFQLFSRLYDLVNNGVRFDIKSMEHLTNPMTCNETVLQLMCTKLGFFPKSTYSSNTLRPLLSVFSYMMKNKGSLESLKIAVYTLLRAEGNTGQVIFDTSELHESPYCINIYFEKEVKNINLLQDILSYVVPIGYNVNIERVKIHKEKTQDIALIDKVEKTPKKDSEVSIIYGRNTTDPAAMKTVGHFDITSIIGSNNITGEDNGN